MMDHHAERIQFQPRLKRKIKKLKKEYDTRRKAPLV